MTDDQTPSASTDDSIENGGSSPFAPPSPQLGIVHLMLWTAGTALLVLGYRLSPNLLEGPEQFQWMTTCMYALRGVVYGPALAVLGIYIARRWRGVRFPSEPGEWLLMAIGAKIVLSLAWAPLLRYWWDRPDLFLWGRPHSLWALAMGLQLLTFAAVYAVPLVRFEGSRLWRRIFTMKVVEFTCLASAFLVVEFIRPRNQWLPISLCVFAVALEIAVVAAMAISVFLDRRQAVRRSWLHRTGVVVYIVGAGFEFSWQVATWQSAF